MSADSTSLTTSLLEFLERLEQERIGYHLQHTRPESIMVSIAVPGERWEVEFLEDGHVEIEKFIGDGQISGEALLDTLFAAHGSTATSDPSDN